MEHIQAQRAGLKGSDQGPLCWENLRAGEDRKKPFFFTPVAGESVMEKKPLVRQAAAQDRGIGVWSVPFQCAEKKTTWGGPVAGQKKEVILLGLGAGKKEACDDPENGGGEPQAGGMVAFSVPVRYRFQHAVLIVPINLATAAVFLRCEEAVFLKAQTFKAVNVGLFSNAPLRLCSAEKT